jgi:putative FmdB family regulatory protein
MPIFEYECRACKTRFEQLVFDRTVEIACKKCGSKDIVQQLSTFAVSSETSKSSPPPQGCAGCPGMQGGSCSMNH